MFKSLKVRFVAVFAAFITVSFLVVSLIAAASIKGVAETLAAKQGYPVIQKASQIINGDKFESLAKSMKSSDSYYEELRLALFELKETVGCEYLYTMVPKSNKTYVYVVDGSCPPSDSANFSPIGTEEDLSDWGNAPIEAFESGSETTSKLTKQEPWGYQISSYKAIKNSSGRTVGIIGCDFKVEEIVARMSSESLKLFLLGIFFILVGGTLIWLFATDIFGSIKKISDSLKQISEGTADLTSRIPENGDNELSALSKSCNFVIESLANLVANLQKNANVLTENGTTLNKKMNALLMEIEREADEIEVIDSSISAQSEKIASVSDGVDSVENQIRNLEQRVNDQISAISESSASIEEISANINSVGKTVGQISEEFGNLVEQAKNGVQIQNEVGEQISEIALQSQNLTEANAAIAAIAEQTNLLAMNAAIEAAHAGELGKGFSVVADEIRTLAETSATQSGEIRTLLEGISAAIQGIVESSKRSSAAFDSVGQKISQTDSMIREVRAGMVEETEGVQTILRTMTTLDGTTKAITDASFAMKKESERMFNEISSLRTISESTSEKSQQIAKEMENMRIQAEDASEAERNATKATDSVVSMVSGFKV